MGGGGNSGPTLQQQQLQTAQALTSANLNLQENAQRKAILNAMQGTRVFKGSALSRAVTGNTPGEGGVQGTGAPSNAQTAASRSVVAPVSSSLLDQQTQGSGATSSGGVGASGAAGAAARAGAGGYRGGGR